MPSLNSRPWIRLATILLVGAAASLQGCQSQRPAAPTIAFVPQSAEGLLWEMERLGATAKAASLKFQIAWNAPTSESDVTGQVSLIDQAASGEFAGLVLAPNHPLAPLPALRRVLEADLPVVVVSTPLDLPPSSKLGYIVNDNAQMGALAAAEIARLINGRGSIALVGISRTATGVISRARGAEEFLASEFPNIRVVSRRGSAFTASGAQDGTISVLAQHPDLKAILTLTFNSTRGVHAALRNRRLQQQVQLVGCEQDTDLLNYVGTGEIAAVVAENTHQMAREAVGAISAFREGSPIPALSLVPPMLITKEVLGSAEAQPYIYPYRGQQ